MHIYVIEYIVFVSSADPGFTTQKETAYFADYDGVLDFFRRYAPSPDFDRELESAHVTKVWMVLTKPIDIK